MNFNKELKQRLTISGRMKKVAHAMKIVAATRLRSAQSLAQTESSYAGSLHDIIKKVSRRLGVDAPPLWRRRIINKIDLLVLLSNTGHCGSFNENLMKNVREEINRHKNHGIKVAVFALGKEAPKYFDRGTMFLGELNANADLETRLGFFFADRFLSGESDGASIAFNEFRSAISQKPIFWDILPLHWRGQGHGRGEEYIYEPKRDSMLPFLAEKSVKTTIRQALLESIAAELVSRMLTMSNAEKNADEMQTNIQKQYNRLRQSSITSGLRDIISGTQLLGKDVF